jgi:flagellar hook-associated protein 1 FlgK
MGLTQTLATSLSGLRATQSGLSVIAGNIANAQTPGYVAQSSQQIATVSGDVGDSVRVASINRILDQFVQQQLRTETSGGSYADLKSSLYQQLQQVYGQPGSSTTLDSTFNSFTSAVQALTTSPSSSAAQSQTISAAQALVGQLNGATATIQQLRTQADVGIANDVQQANTALQQIADINQQLQSTTTADSTTALLEDQRDQYIDQLSKLIDIRVVPGGNNQVTVFTGSGAQLVGSQAAQFDFSPTGSITAAQQWNADPTKSGLSTISLVSPGGGSIDLVSNGSVRSGELAAYLNMRDNVLVQAQSQIDAIASQMSSALSDTTTAGSAVTGPPNGFDTDISGMLAGNTTTVTYTDSSSVQHTISIVRVDDPSALPLSNSETTNPNDTVIGVDFSGGLGSVVTQLNTALSATGLQFSAASGLLRTRDTGPGTVTVNSVATTTTTTSLAGGSGALPLFVDGTANYTGAITASGDQSIGYAGRIQVNGALIADPSQLVSYQANTPAGDATRPNFIYNQLVNGSLAFAPTTGIGSSTSPFQGTLSAFMGQVVSMQSLATTAATNLQAGQDIVVNALQTRFNSTSAVSIDTEMANLLTLQNNYGANARVMTTVNQMLTTLMQMI